MVTFAVTSSIKSIEGATLYPGMTAQVTITTAEQKDVLLVPNSALTYAKSRTGRSATASPSTAAATGGQADGAGTSVMVLQNGQPTAVRVTTGLSDGTNTAVTGRLQEGQAVVTGQSGGTTGGAATGGATTGTTRTTQSSNPLTAGGPGGGPPPGVKPGGGA